MHCLVCELLQAPRKQLTLEKKLDVKARGPPCPGLILKQKQHVKRHDRTYMRKFNADYYKKFSWLCGCSEMNKLFCFPCLLFGGGGLWSKDGFFDLNHLVQSAKAHENSQNHIHNVITLSFLGKTNIAACLSESFRSNVADHNRKVNENRYILNIIVNCIKFCGSFDLALRGHDESTDSLNPGVFRGLINFTAELDSALKNHIEKSPVFSGLSKTIQNDILDCIFHVCQEEIRKQINPSDYMAVIADEMSDTSNIFQMAIVFRFIKNGKPKEMFYKFYQPSGHNAESLAVNILSALSEIDSAEKKLVVQTYNGAAVMSGEKSGVQRLIKDKYPRAEFLHCYAHQLNLVMAKAAGINSSVRFFFANLTGLCSFFSTSPQRTSVLHEVVGKRLPRSAPTRWNFNSRSVNTVFENIDDISECLYQLQKTSLNHQTILESSGFLKILQDEEFLFWLKFFHPLMMQVDVLNAYFQRRNADAVEAKAKIDIFEREVNNIRNTEHENLGQPAKRKRSSENMMSHLCRQSEQVCDVILLEIKERFAFTGHLSATALLNNEKFKLYRKSFPSDCLRQVVQSYNYIEEPRLKTELKVLYSSEQFMDVPDANSFIQVIQQNNLTGTLREVNKLCEILTVSPISSAEAERAFSALKRVKTFLRNTMGHNRLNALAMLSIEKELVHGMADFNRRVIEKFAAMKDRSLELIYK